MSLFKKVYGLLLGIAACVIFILIENNGLFLGMSVNRFFPCAENPASSFPCYGIYDVAAMILVFVIGLILVGVIVFRLAPRRFVIPITAFVLAIIAVIAIIAFHFASTPGAPVVQPTLIPSVAITPTMPATASGMNMLFAATEGAIFLYDVPTASAWQIISVSYPDVTLGFSERINSTMLGFAVSYPSQGNDGPTTAVYTVALDSGTLATLAKIPGIVYFDFISPTEFAYARPDDPNGGFNSNYDDVFLFQNGTSTKIGYLADQIPDGSTLVVSPDGHHLFFANEIYNMQTKVWQAVSKGCTGNNAAWLGDDILVLRTIRDDSGRGMLCYYNLRTGTDTAIGVEQGFAVAGTRIIYETPPAGADMDSPVQIYIYDPVTKTDTPLIADALLLPFDASIGDSPWLLYQPMERNLQECEEIGCIGGVASGSPMLMNLQNLSTPPIPVSVPIPTGTEAFFFF